MIKDDIITKRTNISEHEEGHVRNMTQFERDNNLRENSEFEPYLKEFNELLAKTFHLSFKMMEELILEPSDKENFYKLIKTCYRDKKTVEEALKIYRNKFKKYLR